MENFCKLASRRNNVYLDTSNMPAYYRLGQAIEWAGVEKILFGSDGFWCNPSVEKSKIEILTDHAPFKTKKLTDEEVKMILGGNLIRILEGKS